MVVKITLEKVVVAAEDVEASVITDNNRQLVSPEKITGTDFQEPQNLPKTCRHPKERATLSKQKYFGTDNASSCIVARYPFRLCWHLKWFNKAGHF